MSAKNDTKKTEEYVARHDITSMVSLTEAGTLDVDKDIHEKTVLADTGITLDQLRKLQQQDIQLAAAVTHVAGGLFADAAKADANLSESGFSYNVGDTTKVSGVFSRDQKDHVVVAFETTQRNAEFARVIKSVNALFDNIDS